MYVYLFLAGIRNQACRHVNASVLLWANVPALTLDVVI